MTRSELIRRIALRGQIPYASASACLELVERELHDALLQRETVCLQGVCRMSIREYTYQVRNVKGTGRKAARRGVLYVKMIRSLRRDISRQSEDS